MVHSAKNEYCDLQQRSSVQQKLLRRIYPVCDSATTLFMTKGEDPYIHQARHCTLALMGEFQNGKSTLFNYLCDGRELSPMGNGISTSCCRVAAHALSDAQETEHAYVQWRTEDELRSLIENALSRDKVTYLNHAEPLLAEKLLKAPDATETTDSRAQRDMLRFALLAAHFYPKYAHLCRREKSRRSLQQAVQLASYPSDWEVLWVKVRAAEGRLKGIFTEETAAFVFCRGIDLYLHSPMLSALGCSVVDSPGFNSSEWDNKIAHECAREASSILYILNGKDSLDVSELDLLKKLPKDKIIFAANLRTDRKNWKRIVENSIKPKLTEPGLDFVNPVVHEFHAAMALRARELFLLEIGQLCPTSRESIEHDMVKEGCPKPYDDEAVKEFIRIKLERYAENLVGIFAAKNLKDDFYTPVNLENESGVPNMLPDVIQEVLRRHVDLSLACVKAACAMRTRVANFSTLCDEYDSMLRRLINDCKDVLKELTEEQENVAKYLYEDTEEPSWTSKLFGSPSRKYVHREPSLERAKTFGKTMLAEYKERLRRIWDSEMRHDLQMKYEAAKAEVQNWTRQWPGIAAFVNQSQDFPTDWKQRLDNIHFQCDLTRPPDYPQDLLKHYHKQCSRKMIENTESPVKMLENLHRVTTKTFTQAEAEMERLLKKISDALDAAGLRDENAINSLHEEMDADLRHSSCELKKFPHHYTTNPLH